MQQLHTEQVFEPPRFFSRCAELTEPNKWIAQTEFEQLRGSDLPLLRVFVTRSDQHERSWVFRHLLTPVPSVLTWLYTLCQASVGLQPGGGLTRGV